MVEESDFKLVFRVYLRIEHQFLGKTVQIEDFPQK